MIKGEKMLLAAWVFIAIGVCSAFYGFPPGVLLLALGLLLQRKSGFST